MPLRITIPYVVLAGASVAMCFIDVFPGVGVVRAAPTVLLAIAAFLATRRRFGVWVAAAVALGAAGDFFLASQARAGFIPGLVAFLIGHLFYLRAFTRDLRFDRRRIVLLACALAVLLALAVATAASLLRHGEAALLAPVAIYVAVLAATMVVCVAHQSPTPWIAAGGLVFVFSDGHIAVNHMLLAAPLLPITLSGYVTYYLAQYLLVLGAARETAAAHD